MNAIGQYLSVLDQGICSTLNLVAAGFEYSGAREAETAATGTYLKAEFVHPGTRRKVTIAYFPNPADPRTNETLCVHVTRNADEAYAGTFSVNSFLKHNGAGPAALRALDLKAHSGSADQKVQRVLSEVAKIFGSDLRDVIAGTEWVDVPIDWGDHK